MAAGTSSSATIVKEVHEDLKGRMEMYFKDPKKKFPTGMSAFDNAMGGWGSGEFAVITAGTGMGKSAIMMWWMDVINMAGGNVVYVSIEMSYEDMMERYHAMFTKT